MTIDVPALAVYEGTRTVQADPAAKQAAYDAATTCVQTGGAGNPIVCTLSTTFDDDSWWQVKVDVDLSAYPSGTQIDS